MTKRKILLGTKEQRMNRIFGRENEQKLKELGYHTWDNFTQARFREMIIRDAFAKSKKETV